MERKDHPFWELVGIRVVFWAATALSLIWVPVASGNLVTGTFAQWDAHWFLRVAEHGYDRQSAAFFPLTPLLVHALAWVVRSPALAGALLSLAAGGAAAWALYELARPLLGRGGARDAVLYLALFPTAYVFTAVYSDALFLALSTASFLAAVRKRAWTAGVLGGLAVAARLVGIALLPALVCLLWPRARREAWRLAPLLALPAAVGAYSLYLHYAVGDWLAWRHAQLGWERETPALGPVGGLWWAVQAAGHGARDLVAQLPDARHFGQPQQVELWNVLSLLLFLAACWLTWVAWRRLGVAYGLYAAATLVVVLAAPSRGFPLVSLPRYVMDCFPLLLALVAVTRRRGRDATLVALAALGGVACVAFAHGVWVA